MSDGHGDDVAASHADVAGGLVAEMQQVAEHLPLGGREVAGDGPRILGLLDRFLDLLAQRRLGCPRRRSGGACRATAAIRPRPRPGWPSGGSLIGIGDAEPVERADLARLHVGRFAHRHDGRSRADAACRGPSVRGMVLDAHALVGGLGLADAARENDVAKQQFWTRQHLHLIKSSASAIGKGQDVGRLVLAAPFGVERADLFVAGQPDRHFDRARSRSQAAEMRFRRSPLRRRCGRAAPRSGYCPIPRRLRWRSRASPCPGPS